MGKKTTKRVVVPKPTIKETKMPIDPALFNPSPSYRYRSDLDKELAEDDLMDARDLKRLRVREITAKREARIREFEERSGTGNLRGSRDREELAKALITNSQVQAQWLSMSPEARAILMTSASTLTQQGQSTSAIANLLPFMMLQMKQNPGTSAKELIELINVLRPVGNPGKSETTELLKVLIPALQQQQSSKGGVVETLNVVLALFDRMAQKDRELYIQQLKHLEGQIINPVEWIKTMQSNAELFSRGAPNIEIERLRAENQERMMRLNFDHQKWRDSKDLEKISETGRLQMMGDIFNRGLDTAKPLLEKFVGGVASAKSKGAKAVTALSCVDCGTVIPVKGEPAAVTCPSCGLVHQKNINILGQSAPPPPKVQAGHSTFTMEK